MEKVHPYSGLAGGWCIYCGQHETEHKIRTKKLPSLQPVYIIPPGIELIGEVERKARASPFDELNDVLVDDLGHFDFSDL